MKVSDHKITFMGDSVSWDLPGRAAGFLERKEVVCAIVGAGAVLTVVNSSLFTLGLGLIQATALYGIDRFERGYLLKQAKLTAAEYCINTKPGRDTPSNLPRWGLSADAARLAYERSAYAAAVLIAFTEAVAEACSVKGLITPVSADLLAGTITTALLPTVVRFARGWYRWRKVAKGDWIIEDKGPPPEPVRKAKPLQPGFAAPSA